MDPDATADDLDGGKRGQHVAAEMHLTRRPAIGLQPVAYRAEAPERTRNGMRDRHLREFSSHIEDSGEIPCSGVVGYNLRVLGLAFTFKIRQTSQATSTSPVTTITADDPRRSRQVKQKVSRWAGTKTPQTGSRNHAGQASGAHARHGTPLTSRLRIQ